MIRVHKAYPNFHVSEDGHRLQLGGDEPMWFSGANGSIKEYRSVFLQYEDSCPRAHSSPVGIVESVSQD